MNRYVLLAPVLAALLQPLSAAAESPLYIGGSVGRGDIITSEARLFRELRDLGNQLNSVDFDGEDSGYRVYAGLHLTEYFAVELGYMDLGTAKTAVSANTVTDKLLADVAAVAPAMPKGPTLTAVGILPATLFGVHSDSGWSRLSLLLKLGFIDPDVDVRATVNGSLVTRRSVNAETLYGVGIQFTMSDRLSFRAEVENLDFSDSVRYPSASLQYRY